MEQSTNAIHLILNDHKKVNELFHLYHLASDPLEKFRVAQIICQELVPLSFCALL